MYQSHILEYLDATVMKVPDKIAFANESEHFTFQEVYTSSGKTATFLNQEGYAGEPIFLFMNKHPKTIIVMLGVIASGNYYVPIDEEMPEARIQLILQNVQPRAMICDSETIQLAHKLEFEGAVYHYEEMMQITEDQKALKAIRRKSIDTDPLYVVFTSGSTGIPKGVVASHRSVIDYIEQLSEELGFSEDTVFANQAPLYFDAALKEIGPTLKFGATTYIVPKSMFLFPVQLVEFLNTYKVNTICWVVSALTMISSFNTFKVVKPEYLHTIAFVGEVFPMRQFHIWREALPDVAYTNLYGPTETTGVCCYYHIKRTFQSDEVLPIGYPFRNTDILLLDEKNESAEEGEICIRGSSLALGYYHDFERTCESFVQNPLNTVYPELIYHTGDIGKYNEYGELMFVSRRDDQVKHMGHRIELGEIEANATANENIQAACCIYNSVKGKIILYYVGDMMEKTLALKIREMLPRYMVPNAIRRLDTMPLTPNGKINRRLLKERNKQERE